MRQRENCQTCSVCQCFDHFFSLTHLLKEVDELAHVALVAGGAEDVLLEGPLFVQLEQHHLSWGNNGTVRSIHLYSAVKNERGQGCVN